MAERAKAVQEAFEDRQDNTEKALEELFAEIAENEERKKEQAAKGLDGLTYFICRKFTDEGIPNAEKVSREGAGSLREVPELEDGRGGAAGSAQEGDLRDFLRRG